MPDIHPVARAGFSTVAQQYERGRPGYPPAAVGRLVERLGIGHAGVVVDVGAGTGKLTRALTPTGAHVIAVEPLHEMAALIHRTSPGALVLGATAEHLPFADASVDAITVAQAFHWFDAAAAWTEFARVLRPGRGVGIIWNARDRSVDWVDAVWAIMDDVEKQAPWRDHTSSAFDFSNPALGPFEPLTCETFSHIVSTTPRDMIDRVASVSHVAVLPDARRQRVLDRVAEVLPPGERLEVPYRVDVYTTRLT